MKLWILTSLILTSVCVCKITAQGHFESCCLSHARNVHQKNLYKHAKGYRLQEINESCNIKAVIFLLPRKDRVVCGNPRDGWVQDLIKHIIRRTYNHSAAFQKSATRNKEARRRRRPGKGFNIDSTTHIPWYQYAVQEEQEIHSEWLDMAHQIQQPIETDQREHETYGERRTRNFAKKHVNLHRLDH